MRRSLSEPSARLSGVHVLPHTVSCLIQADGGRVLLVEGMQLAD